MPTVFRSNGVPGVVLDKDDMRALRWLRKQGACNGVYRLPKHFKATTGWYLSHRQLVSKKTKTFRSRPSTKTNAYSLTELGCLFLQTAKRFQVSRSTETAWVTQTPTGRTRRRILRLRRQAIIARRTHVYDGRPLDADDLARLYTSTRRRAITSWVVNFLYQEGFPLKQIAWAIRPWSSLASEVTVSEAVRRLNLPRRRNIVTRRSDTPWSDFSEQWMALRSEGSSYHDIARAYGTRAETVKKYVESYTD